MRGRTAHTVRRAGRALALPDPYRLLTALYPANVDLLAAVIKAWEEMSKGRSLGRAIWNIRTKHLLGVVG